MCYTVYLSRSTHNIRLFVQCAYIVTYRRLSKRGVTVAEVIPLSGLSLGYCLSQPNRFLVVVIIQTNYSSQMICYRRQKVAYRHMTQPAKDWEVGDHCLIKELCCHQAVMPRLLCEPCRCYIHARIYQIWSKSVGIFLRNWRFVGSLHANFDQNRLNVKKFAKNRVLKQAARKD